MFEYFYNEILRKTVIGFGSLFNDIQIKHTNSNDSVVSVIKVPLAYGPTQKFLARLEQSENLNKPVQITLPRMSFELVGMTYDSTRKVTTTQSFKSTISSDGTDIRRTYMPVPYNLQFELAIMSKLNDDMLQIVEQILPYFQPAYTLTIDLVEQIGEKRDVPIVIENITMQDDYEGDFTTRRVLLYTIRFTAKTYLFGPTSPSSISKDIIKKVSLGLSVGDGSVPKREVVYSVEPRATKNYTGIVATNLAENINEDVSVFLVDNSSSLTKNTYIEMNGESMYIEEISNNNIKVVRGVDGTTKSSHVLGTSIKNITSSDDSLIESGDDFGFNGSIA
jgi:hypothetical protein